MMLTRLIRRQLMVFAVLGTVALLFTGIVYAQIPQRLGIGHDTVRIEFSDASGLYPSAIVTYRGIKVGKVDSLDVTDEKAIAVVTLSTADRVPRSAVAELRSTSAIGEQYIDLVPNDNAGPYLGDGDTIPVAQSRPMPQITPVLEKLNDLLASVPSQETRNVLDQVDQGLGGAADDVRGIVDATSDLVATAQTRLDETRDLIAAAQPVLTTQQRIADRTLTWSRSLALLTGSVADNSDGLTALLTSGPSALARTRSTVDDLSQTLPMLVTSLATTSEVAKVYLPNIEQTLVTYPALVAAAQGVLKPHADEGAANLDLRVQVNDPPSCINGYVPVADRRSPTDTSFRPAPGLYCRAPADSPKGVRGARNYPCPNSDKRSATPAGCGLEFANASEIPVITYQQRTGLFVAPDGRTYRAGDVAGASTEGWRDLLLAPLGITP